MTSADGAAARAVSSLQRRRTCRGKRTMKLDRRDFFAKLGGAAAIAAMTHEARADALEHYLMGAAGPAAAASGAAPTGAAGDGKPFPTTAEIEAQIETRPSR